MQYRTWRHTLKSLPGYDSGQVDANTRFGYGPTIVSLVSEMLQPLLRGL